MRPLFLLTIAVMVLAASQIKVVYDFNGVVVNKTCYLIKTQGLPVYTIVSSVGVNESAKIPLVRSFIHELKNTSGVHIRGDETLGEDVLQRLKEEGGKTDVWLEVYVFNNISLVKRIIDKAKGLGVGLTIYYINATDPGPWPGREKAVEMMRSWVNEYVKRYGKDARFGIGFILDIPVVTLTVFNSTEEEADKVAARVREIVPCRYPIVYFTDEEYLYPAPLTSYNTDSQHAQGLALSSADDLLERRDASQIRDDAPAVEDALVAKRADSPMDWVGVLLAALFAALATLAVVLYRVGDRF
ncbi:hypothetical protein [Pyrobaculum aerophilum]|uniref:Uncharacterized protein n=1 Tax=Pyrobaculum aerophilum TaxID=13773 RepID=A0A371R1I1_9CREN|nr:hypothetical protein [Pyrobaculum aerophilum]RFA96884.1 hypothetical protein CGL51_04195 [Pyrobaculum aerophilum]RFA97405.1 hypothetical protein CGL52_09435 [Pyrobaculum aerophilum]